MQEWPLQGPDGIKDNKNLVMVQKLSSNLRMLKRDSHSATKTLPSKPSRIVKRRRALLAYQCMLVSCEDFLLQVCSFKKFHKLCYHFLTHIPSLQFRNCFRASRVCFGKLSGLWMCILRSEMSNVKCSILSLAAVDA